MDAEKLKHFRSLLLTQLRQHTEQVRTDQAAALELYDDGVKDSVDLSVQDLNKEIALRLGERSSQVVADVDQALLRMKEATGYVGVAVNRSTNGASKRCPPRVTTQSARRRLKARMAKTISRRCKPFHFPFVIFHFPFV